MSQQEVYSKQRTAQLTVVKGVTALLIGAVLAISVLGCASGSPSSSTPTMTPTPQVWHMLLRQLAPNCNNPQGVVWYVHSKGTSLSCSGSALAMQQISKYFAEVDLVQVDGSTYSQTKFRVQVQVTFQNPHDIMTMAALLVQTPAAVNAVGGYLFVLSPAGKWYLQNVTATGGTQIVTNGSVSINSSQPVTITVEVRNSMLHCFINNRPVVSYTDNLNPSPGQVGLLVEGPSVGERSSVLYSNFELDG